MNARPLARPLAWLNLAANCLLSARVVIIFGAECSVPPARNISSGCGGGP